MARSGRNVSSIVRDMLRKDASAKPAKMVEELAAMGIKGISPTYISAIKTRFLKAGGKEPGKRGRPRVKSGPGSRAVARATRAATADFSNAEITYQALEKASVLVKELGSVDKAQRVLQALAGLIE